MFLHHLHEGILIAARALMTNKLRSILTTLGIIIGVATVSLMGSAINGLNNAFHDSLSMLGPDVLFVNKRQWGPGEDWWKTRNRRDITIRDAKRLIEELTVARAVAIESGTMRMVKHENRSARGVHVMGCNEQGAYVRGFSIAEGRFLSPEEVAGARPVCVLGAELAKNLFPNESPLGQRVEIGGSRAEVIGVLERIGSFFVNIDKLVIVPITRFLDQYAWRAHVDISVKVLPGVNLADAREEVRGIMRKIRRLGPADADDFAINQQDLIIDEFNRIGGMIAGGGLFLTGLSLFVGGIGIMNIMFVSVVERTREIGLRKALGAKRRAILLQFLVEALALCVLGGAIGMGIAYGVTRVLQTQASFPAAMSIPVVLLGLAVSMLTGLLAGYFPARRASRLSPVEALRHE